MIGADLPRHGISFPSRYLTIRSVFPILLSFVLAALVLAGCLVGVLAFHKTEATVAVDPTPVDLPTDPIADPGPWPRSSRVAIDAAARSPVRQRRDCRVRIEGEMKQDLFLVLFDGESKARLAVRTIATPLPRIVEFASIPTGTHYVHLARHADLAKRNYIASAAITVGERAAKPTTLRAMMRSLRVQLTQSAGLTAEDRRASIEDIPVLLRRRDDPDWRYFDAPTDRMVATDSDGAVVFHGLGPGTYVLSTPGFEPDATETSRLTFELEKFDQSRPIRGRAR